MIKQIGFCLLLLVVIGLNACGFKLKGQYYLPESLKTLHLTSEKRFSPLSKQVKLRLNQNQIHLVEKPDPEVAELRILPEQFQRRTLSLFPNGQVAEYELIYQVRFQLYQPSKESRTFEFELSREFRDDPNNALAKERERQLILNELRIMASDRILAQLTSLQ